MEVDTIVINARRKVDALAVMAATDSQMTVQTSDDPVGALMAKYDKDKNGTFDVHEGAASGNERTEVGQEVRVDRPRPPAPRLPDPEVVAGPESELQGWTPNLT